MKLALVAAACGGAATAPPSNVSPTAPPNPRAAEVFVHPEWVGHDVTLDIVEPIETIGTTPGRYEVEMPNGHDDDRLQLAGSAELHPPVTVRGTLRTADQGLALDVSEARPLVPPPPDKLASASELVDHPDQWDGKRVVVEDNYLVGFEASILGARVWLDYYPDTKVHCEPKDDPKREESKSRVRVVGYAYTARKRYGHLGMARATILATDVTYLGGDCK